MSLRRPGCIYFVLDETCGLVKIGHTVGKPDLRATQIAGCNPHPTRLIATIENVSTEREAEIHLSLTALRRHREWFTYNDELKTFISEHAQEWKPTNRVHALCERCGHIRKRDRSKPCSVCSMGRGTAGRRRASDEDAA